MFNGNSHGHYDANQVYNMRRAARIQAQENARAMASQATQTNEGRRSVASTGLAVYLNHKLRPNQNFSSIMSEQQEAEYHNIGKTVLGLAVCPVITIIRLLKD